MLKAMRYYVRRGAAWLKRRLLPPLPPAPEPDVLPHPLWMERRLKDRLSSYPRIQASCLFSLMTPVFNPPSGYFRVLGKSILAQDYPEWEWVIVDNGTTHSDVQYLMEYFARDPRVKLVRTRQPQGIIGGMRLALENSTGRYVCPVDHDDRLYPDALRVVAACLHHRQWPALAYTDEDKILPDGAAGLPSFKPDWDPLLFLNACYIAHLGVMDRQKALELGAYTDSHAEGTPDGDTFCRFIAAGHMPLHIPEIVYSWRMHEQSTALRGVEAKPYVTANQKHVLTGYIRKQGLHGRITLRTNPLPGLAGSWRVDAAPEPVPVVILPGGNKPACMALRDRLKLTPQVSSVHGLRTSSWRRSLEAWSDEQWLALLSPECLPLTTDWVREFTAVRQAVPGAVMAGGVLRDQEGIVISAGLAWGMEGLMASPLAGFPSRDYAAGQGMLCFQRSVAAVDQRFCMIQAGFLRAVLNQSESDLADPLFPAWCAAVARQQQRHIVFTPHAHCLISDMPSNRQANETDRYRFLMEYGHWLASDPYYSRFLGLTREFACQPVHPARRTVALRTVLSALTDSVTEYQTWIGSQEKYRSFLEDEPLERNRPTAARLICSSQKTSLVVCP